MLTKSFLSYCSDMWLYHFAFADLTNYFNQVTTKIMDKILRRITIEVRVPKKI